MTISEKEVFKVLKDEQNDINNYLVFLKEEGEQVKEDNLVLDLSEIVNVDLQFLTDLLPWAKASRDKKRSFVVVTNSVEISEVPEELNVVPTLGEAEDLIQMEEIERDLGF